MRERWIMHIKRFVHLLTFRHTAYFNARRIGGDLIHLFKAQLEELRGVLAKARLQRGHGNLRIFRMLIQNLYDLLALVLCRHRLMAEAGKALVIVIIDKAHILPLGGLRFLSEGSEHFVDDEHAAHPDG